MVVLYFADCAVAYDTRDTKRRRRLAMCVDETTLSLPCNVSVWIVPGTYPVEG